MRKLSGGGGERRVVGAVAFEVAALMSRAAGLWRALGDAEVGRLRGDRVRLEGVRLLVADDDAALLSLALAEMAAACADLSRAVARLSARCADPLLRRFDALFAALVRGGRLADPHRLRYSAARKMDRKARKMQRLVASTALLSQELDVLAELEQAAAGGLRRSGTRRKGAANGGGGEGEAARRVAQQRQEVDHLRAASLWNRSFDYAVRLLARSLFTIVARIAQVFGLEPKNVATMDDDAMISLATTRLSWTNSFVGSVHSLVYPSDFAADTHTPRRSLLDAKSGKVSNGGEHVRRFLVSRSQSLRQLKWPMAGKHLIGCMVSGSRSPDSERWKIHGDGDLPLSFSYYVSASNDDYSSINSPFQGDHTNSNLSIVFESSSHNWVMNAPAVTTLGAAALALHYANLIIFIEKLAVAPRHICPDERDALYNMLTDRIRASLRARLRPIAKNMAASSSSSSSACDPAMAAEWSDTVQRILGWLAPLAHNMLRWQSERNFEQRNVASSGTGVLLLQTLHFADQKKSEAAIVELLVGLNYLWKAGRELDAKAKKLVSGGGKRDEFTDYYSSNRMECR
ncbi:uncharacterized protein LOC127756204 [Oryza glaberrima]|uniref:Hypothetical_protein n=1 Tax=Oryza glaberrima TaxID=4538 RepID=G2XLI9_ORYGL|nr:uncharacterized protein LOC127756204 [Oryza glaberrima]CBX24459.1 hypothetical_protein [Oryza glaberrima]